MSQQTSLYNFYKSVNPKQSMKLNKKAGTVAAKFPHNNQKTKIRRPDKTRRKSLSAMNPSKSPRKLSVESDGNFAVDLVDLTASSNESDSTHSELKTPKISRESSFDDNLTITPTNNRKGRKRSSDLTANGVSSSPRKKVLSNGARSVIKHLRHRSPNKLFHKEAIDTSQVSEMIDNLNLARAGVFPKNHIDLDKYYSDLEIEAKVVDCDIDAIFLAYDSNGVVIPKEKHAQHLFNIITEVFLNPTNCGYFHDNELDQVFGILILTEQAQTLLARLIQRKHCWKRANAIQYPTIGDNLRGYFDELEEHNLLTTDMRNESIETLLTMLSVDEVHDICRQSKIPRQSNKNLAIKHLLKTGHMRPLFPGMQSPAEVLRKTILTALGYCVRLPKEVISLVNKMVTLFIPSEDVTTELSNLFLKLTMTKNGSLRFPEVPVQHYPIFRNWEHLLSYVEGRSQWKRATEITRGSKENCNNLRSLGRDAHSRLMVLLRQNPARQQDMVIPRHVQKFREEYVCIQIVTTCLDVFKKENSTIPEAVEMLRNLISQKSYLQSRKGEWYEELALIEMNHRKDLEAAALVTIEGLNLENITESGKHVLTKRASTIVKRKSGLSMNTRLQLRNLISNEMPGNTPTVSIHANVIQGNQPGRKSTWSLDVGDGDKRYMSVEEIAQYYYRNNGYPEGWHCEGSLPVTLFTLLMWDELYHISVPAAYLSAYQKAPLDLFTSEFYNNRKEHIDKRIDFIKTLSIDALGNLIGSSLEIRQHYHSLIQSLPTNTKQLTDIVRCMGTSVVIGICERLVSNFSGWKSGFPDLLVWNSIALKCKFVEVKGPRDTLSAKQTLWLRYLEDLGASTEVCEVRAGPRSQ